MVSVRVYAAWHESGHAICAWRLGGTVEELSITSDGRGGHCRIHGLDGMQWMIQVCAANVAVSVSPFMSHPIPVVEPATAAATTDTQYIEAAATAGGVELRALTEYGASQAMASIKPFINVLDAMAVCLARRLVISGEDFEAMMRGFGVTPFVPEPFMPPLEAIL